MSKATLSPILGTTSTGDDIVLSADAVTQGCGIVARRRSGKSNLAGVMEETFSARGDPWVCLDPVSAHWGIRYLDAKGKPGKPSGCEVLIVGGKYGDVALDERAGAALAQILVDTNISCVVDLGAESMNTTQKFVADFATELLRINETPRHVFLEEAHVFVPQQLVWDNQKLVLGALTKMITMGGGKGIGYTLITQRTASVAKAVLEQIDNLFVLRMSGPNDLKAVQGWFEHNVGDKAQMGEILAGLPSFKPGEAWLLSPDWMHKVQRVMIRERTTYHAGRTPKRGEAPVAPKRVELGQVIGRYRDAATKRQIAVKEQTDLKAENARLTTELAKVGNAGAKPCDHPKLIKAMEMAAGLTQREFQQAAADRESLRLALADAESSINVLLASLEHVSAHAKATVDNQRRSPTERKRRLLNEEVGRLTKRVSNTADEIAQRESTRLARGGTRRLSGIAPKDPSEIGLVPPPPRPLPPAQSPPFDGDLRPAQANVLNAAATLEAFGITSIPIPSIAALADRAMGGGFQNLITDLHTLGLLRRTKPGVVEVTEQGRSAAEVEPLQSADDLRARWMLACSTSSRRVLEILIADYPEEVTISELAARTERAMGGGFQNLITELVRKCAATRPRPGMARASDLLFPER